MHLSLYGFGFEKKSKSQVPQTPMQSLPAGPVFLVLCVGAPVTASTDSNAGADQSALHERLCC